MINCPSAFLPRTHQLLHALKLYIHDRQAEQRNTLWFNSERTFSNVWEHQWIFADHAFLESPPWVPHLLICVVGQSFFLWTHWTLYGSHTWLHNHLRYPQLWAMRPTGTSPWVRSRCGSLRPFVSTAISAPGRSQRLHYCCDAPGERRSRCASRSVYKPTLWENVESV